jgi:hypothetical protein
MNGACYFANKHFVHSGDSLYTIDENENKKFLSGEIADRKSVFIPTLEKLYFISGEKIYIISAEGNLSCLTEGAYIPTVIVSKSPAGGGTYLEEYNLLSCSWKEQFLADGESVVYHLEKENITSVISVEIRDENGDMQKIAPDLYSVSIEEGTVTFVTPPSKPDVVGMDNVYIIASKEEGNEDMLFGCTVGAVFGAGGKNDRLFLGGNPKYQGMDFFSASDDFSYFPHMNYSKLSRGQIKGYSVFNGALYTHLSADHSTGMSYIIKREGIEHEDGSDTFVITDEVSSPSFVSANTSLVLNGEALFLSSGGIYGITVSDVTDEKICQLRSAYFGKAFSEYSNSQLSDAHAVIYGDFYMLALDGKLYILDGECKSYFEGTPLCSFQYECYYWENIPARIIWTNGKRLFFGDDKGNIYRFFHDKTANASYVDDNKKVVCYFDTWDIDDRKFFKKKTYVSISAKIGAFLNTGIKIYARTDGYWNEKPIYNSMGRGRYMDFNLVDFESISFSSNRSEVTLCGKIRIRNTDSVRFRLMNDKAEPFALYAFGTEYVQKGNYIR